MMPSILLVGHEPHDRKALRLALEQVGYMVLEAGNALQAFCIGIRRAREIGLLLTEAGLPNISGMQLVEKFSQQFPAIPAVLIVSDTRGPEAETIRRRGFHHLAKPVETEALIGKVREMVGPPVPRKQGIARVQRASRQQRIA